MGNVDQIIHKEDEILRKEEEILGMSGQIKTVADQLNHVAGAVSQVEKRLAGLEKVAGDIVSALHDVQRNSLSKNDLKPLQDSISTVLDVVKKESHDVQSTTERLRTIEHDLGVIQSRV